MHSHCNKGIFTPKTTHESHITNTKVNSLYLLSKAEDKIDIEQ